MTLTRVKGRPDGVTDAVSLELRGFGDVRFVGVCTGDVHELWYGVPGEKFIWRLEDKLPSKAHCADIVTMPDSLTILYEFDFDHKAFLDEIGRDSCRPNFKLFSVRREVLITAGFLPDMKREAATGVLGVNDAPKGAGEAFRKHCPAAKGMTVEVLGVGVVVAMAVESTIEVNENGLRAFRRQRLL